MSQKMSGTESLWPGRVTQVIDPHYFWMQLGTRASLTWFEKLQRDMQEFGRHHFASLDETEQLEYGQVVLVDTEDAGALRYKRGQVARISSGNSVDIFYVDYGNTELTTRDQIMCRLPDIFKNCPPQAVRCSLAAVRPISKNWTTRGTRMFQQVTEGPLLYTLVLHGEPGYCEVSLYPSENEDARSVSHYLLEEEVAMPKDGEMVPEFVRDIPEFMTSYMNRMCPDKQKASTDSHPQTSQDPVTMETTSSTLQPPTNNASPGSSPPNNSRTSDKYIPPNRKYQEQSPRSAGSHVDGSPGSHSSISSSPGQHGNHGPGSAKQPAVVDFFPFDSVSTYPPTPVSPMKSPGRGSNTSGPQEGSYFSRSPSKYEHPDQQSYRGHYQANGHLHNRGKGAEGYYGDSPGRGYYRNSSERGYRKPHDHQQHPHHERSRFAANFDNLPASNTDPGLGLSGKVNAAANLEPHYLNKISERNGQHSVGEGTQMSPVSAQSRYVHSPSRPIPTVKTTTTPFYPPKPSTEMEQAIPPQTVNLTTPQYYNTKSSPSDGYNKHSKDLMPPGFYQSHKSGSPNKLPDPYHMSAGDGYANMGKYPYSSEAASNPAGIYGSEVGADHGYSYGDGDNNQKPQHPRYRQHQYYNQDDATGYYGNPPISGDYIHPGPTTTTAGYNHHDSRHTTTTNNKPKLSNDNNNAGAHHPPRPRIHIPHSTPTKSPSSGDPYMHQKMSPVSPDSAGIAGFNLSELEHTEFASAEMFQQRITQEKLQALQEEAEDIAVESQEQSRLAEIARYGGSADGALQDFRHPVEHEVFEQISEDISNASRDNEDLKRSPVKHYRDPPIPERAAKLEGIPASYVADIDFTEAVKEALDFARTDGIENAKALLDSVVESLRHARVEKQLFDVLLMLLSKAIRDYDLCHQLVMDTINRMNTEMEIKEPLTRALKRQQDLCVQVPVRKNAQHENFARVMAAIFNMAQDWSDSNATIQDSILHTLDKWILFNKKGTQLGQTEKENVFLECFVAFWQVSGSQLLRCNNTFTSRLEGGVKEKLLDENVIRTIRERLLGILLTCFLGDGSTVRGHRASLEDGFSQTPRVTMIPSSCQVKPHMRDISTMTYAEWPEDLSGFDMDETRWHTAVDFNSPEVSLSLRPMGQRSKVTQLSSTPNDMERAYSRGNPNASLGDASQNSSQIPDQSCSSSTAMDAEFTTSNTSCSTHNKAGYSADNSSNNASACAQQSKVCDSVPLSNNSQSNINNSSVGSGNTPNLHKTSKSAPGDHRKTVCETKSASGKTIVDWFDYQPEPQTQADTSPKTAAAVKAVSGENLRQVKKSLDSLSLNSIEETYSVITKGKSNADTAGSGSAITSNKSRKKEKKAAKAAANNQTGNKVVQSNSGAGGKAKVDEAATAFDVSAKADTSKAGATSTTKNSPSKARNISLSTSSVSAVTTSSFGALAESLKVADDEDEEEDGVKDWWGAEEDFESRGKFPPPPKLGLCELHVDTNPDVIIEDEFIEDVNDVIDTADDAEPELGDTDNLGESEVVNEEICAGVLSDSQSPLSQPEDIKPTKQSSDLLQEDNNEHSAKMDDGGAQKVTVGDMYGFSEEMSDDNWDSDDGEGFGDHPLFENELRMEHSRDVNDQINSVGEPKSEASNAVEVEESNYDRNFPKTNLADYIRPVLEDSPSPEPVSRWKPKRRICLTCHEESHKTENCPKGIFLLQ